MKTIKQLSKELNISKEAIYKKVNYQLKEQLEGHIAKLNKITHIDDAGEKIIIQSLNRERREAIQNIINTDTIVSNEPLTDVQPDIQPHLTEYIRLLQEQIKTKDIQLESQNKHISQLINQLGNNQFLIQTEQYRNVLYLQMQAGVTKEFSSQNHMPFWKRIFKR